MFHGHLDGQIIEVSNILKNIICAGKYYICGSKKLIKIIIENPLKSIKIIIENPFIQNKIYTKYTVDS